jgi:DNA-binding NarL/FixJ family response regulator
VRQGVVYLLSTEAEWHACGETRNGAETVHKASQIQPDLVLLDVNLPDVSGLEKSPPFTDRNTEGQDSDISQHDPTQLLPPARRVRMDIWTRAV